MKARIRLGIIGTGAIALHHAAALKSIEGAVIAAASNRGKEKLEAFGKAHGITSLYANYHDMIEKERLDALFVLVSADNVSSVTRDVIPYKLPLLIEKPPGLSRAEASDIAELARAHGTPVMVGLNRRFYSVIEKARNAILAQGKILGVSVYAPERIAKVRELGKFSEALVDKWIFLNSIHMIDLLRYIGGDVASVYARRHALREKNGDGFAAVITFKNGALGSYVSHWNSPGKWSIDIFGEGVRAHIEPLEKAVLIDESSTEIRIEPDAADLDFKPGIYAEDRYFINHVRTGQPIEFPAITIDDAIETLDLIEKISAAPLSQDN